MPASDSPAVIVARFLKANGLTGTYEAFIAESGIPEDFPANGQTLEQLLEEKKAFDYSLQFEKLQVEDKTSVGWAESAPQHPTIVSLPAAANIISTDGAEVDDGINLLVSTADRNLHVLNTTDDTVRRSLSGLHDSPVLSSLVFRKTHVLSASMSGQLISSSLGGREISSRRDHNKYLTKVVVHEDPLNPLIVTIGWDGLLCIYHPNITDEGIYLSDPFATLSLPTKPESVLITTHPETTQPILVLTRSNSSFIYYYTTESAPRLLGRQNLAPHSNSWVAFTPSCIAQSPTSPNTLAVALSTIPHLKLIIVRMLIPPYQPPSPSSPSSSPSSQPVPPATQSSQARSEFLTAETESAAIRTHVSTLAPQTPYSTPVVVWRPDGSGVWVNGDDGVIRGIEAGSGKVVVTLKGGHEAGSKVRCLWAGRIRTTKGGEGEEGDGNKGNEWEERLYSGGFDRRLVVWR